MTDVKAVFAGQHTSFFLKSDGSLWGCGRNEHGQLGDGTTNGHNTNPPVFIMSDVKEVAGANSHTLFLKSDGSVWGSGQGWSGNLGNTTTNDHAFPIFIMDDVKAVSAGEGGSSFFLKKDGSVWACGFNGLALGVGHAGRVYEPVQIMTDVTAVSAARDNALFLKSDGTVWRTGSIKENRQSLQTPDIAWTPLQISGIDQVRMIAAGNLHSVFLKNDGSVWITGMHWWGAQNEGIYKNIRRTPSRFMDGVKAVSASRKSTYFVKSDGSVFFAGLNSWGESGNDLWDERSSEHPAKMMNSGNNTAPSITRLADVSYTLRKVNEYVLPLEFGLIDADTSASQLTLTARSSNPRFVPDKNITFIKVGLLLNDPNRRIELRPVPNLAGSAVITITVSDGMYSASRSFTVTAARPKSSDARLSALGVSVGKLSPAFSKSKTSYRLSVPNRVSSFKLRPTASNAGAVIRVNGKNLKSGLLSSALALKVGTNNIKVAVTAEDGAKRTYNVVVTRAAKAKAK